MKKSNKAKDRADYGAYLIRNLAEELTPLYGSGFSVRQLEQSRRFYRMYPIANAVRSQLNWTQYRLLIQIEDPCICSIKKTSDMNPLQQIEQTYSFQYPKLYHRLYEDGMLNMGAKYPYHSYCPIEYKNGDRLPNKEWLEQEYPKLKENPPLFLYVDWFQVLTPSQLAKEFEFLNQHLTQYPQNQKFFFAPFARAVVDDYMVYCFCYNKEKPTQEPSVVFIREDGEVDILSGNLQNFIFYQLIKWLVAHFHDISFICYGDFYENLRQTLRTHCPYLTEEQAEVLEDIYKREIKEYTRKLTSGDCYTFLTLLHEGEEETLLNKYNPLPKETILLKTV